MKNKKISPKHLIVVFLLILLSIFFNNYKLANHDLFTKKKQDIIDSKNSSEIAFSNRISRRITRSLRRINDDEEVVLLPCYAYKTDDGYYQFTIHGWIFQQIRSKVGFAVLKRAFKVKRLRKNRVRYFLVDNQKRKKLSMKIGDTTYRANKSKSNGHFNKTIKIEASKMSELASEGRIEYSTIAKDGREFISYIYPIEKKGVSVISDIDDTIKFTNCPIQKEMIANTFSRPFKKIEEMDELFQHWQEKYNASFHYVSGSPWQLYPSISEFLDNENFPGGTFHFKKLRYTDRTGIEFLKADQVKHKVKNITKIISQFPQRKFILVGDSGDQDPEIYAIIAKEFPAQVAGIFIRNLNNSPSKRYRDVFKGISIPWRLFEDPYDIMDFTLKLPSTY